MWYLMLYLATLYACRACEHVMGSPDHFSPYFHDKYVRHLWLVRCHGVAGCLTLLLGPWLMSSWFRRTWPAWHRRLGKLYFGALVPSLVAGLAMSLMAFGGHGSRLGLSSLSLAWGATAWKAWSALRSGDIPRHRHWMIRHYALTLGAVSLRIQSAFLVGLGADFPSIYPYLAWTSWLPNLLIAEWLVRRRRPGRPARPRTPSRECRGWRPAARCGSSGG